jgi:hypothetical protein
MKLQSINKKLGCETNLRTQKAGAVELIEAREEVKNGVDRLQSCYTHFD